MTHSFPRTVASLFGAVLFAGVALCAALPVLPVVA